MAGIHLSLSGQPSVPPCRQLTHRSFASSKPVEYLLAFLGTLGGEMVRVHHAHAW